MAFFNEKQINVVKDRLVFVRELLEFRENFKQGKMEYNYMTRSYHHPIRHFEALSYYLCLTCFDILGQKAEFVDFNKWLHAKEFNEEREKAFISCKDSDLLEQIRCITKNYNDLYGATKSFKRFINDVISQAQKEKLLASVRITKQRKNPVEEIEYTATDEIKINYLFSVRNAFTHEGSLHSSFSSLFSEGIDDVYDKTKFFDVIHFEENSTINTTYFVLNWPNILVETIESVIN